MIRKPVADGKYPYSANSLANLKNVNIHLCTLMLQMQNLCNISIICGHRNKEDQTKAFSSKVSKVKWPNSKHNKQPSEAVDFMPYHVKYGALSGSKEQIAAIAKDRKCSENQAKSLVFQQYTFAAGCLIGLAAASGHTIRWGGDWDMDADLTDETFRDMGHVEILIK